MTGAVDSPTTDARVRTVLRNGVLGILVDPVREGRLRDKDWGPGLRGVVACSTLLYVVLLLVIVGASWIRGHAELSYSNGFSAPRIATVLVLASVVWCVSLLVTGALHAPRWIRLGVLVVAVLTILNFGYGEEVWGRNRLFTYAASLALVVITAVVWRRVPRGWEFPVVLVLVAIGILVPLRMNLITSRSLGFDLADPLVAVQVQRLSLLAFPATAFAGVAGVQLAVSASERAVSAAARVPRLVLPLVLLLGLPRLVLTAAHLGGRSTYSGVSRWVEAWGAVFVLLLGGLVMWGLVKVAERAGSAAERPSPERASEEMGQLGTGFAAGLAWTAVPLLLIPSIGLVLASFGVDSGFTRFLPGLSTDLSSIGVVVTGRVVVAALLVVIAVRLARSGRLIPALLAGEVAASIVVVHSRTLTGGLFRIPVSPTMVVEVASAAAVVTVIVLRWRDHLSSDRLGALGAVVVLAWAFALGDLLGSPITTVLGLSGISLVLYGLVWSLLTSATDANKESSVFPRQSRVMLYLANGVFAMAVVAFSVLVRSGTTLVLNVGDPAEIGLQVLGTALLMVVVALLGWRVLRDEPEPGPVSND